MNPPRHDRSRGAPRGLGARAPFLAVLLAGAAITVRATPQVSVQTQAARILQPEASLAPDQLVDAISAARAQIARDPRSAAGYLALGRALRIAGDTERAQQALDQALKLNPQLSGAWYEKGLMSIDSGTMPEATGLFAKAVECDGSNTAARMQLASLLLRRGDWTAAHAQLDAVLKIDPSNAGAHDGLGLILTQQGHPQEAIAEFRKSVRIDPSFAEAQESLGETLAETGDWSGARTALEKALAGNLQDASMATYALANALKHLNDSDGAEAEFSKARTLMRRQVALDKARSNNDRGLQLWYQGDLDGAEAAFRQALADDASYAEAHNNLGGVLWQMKKQAEARDEFAAAIGAKPDFAKARNNLGNALLGEGKLDAAIKEFRAAVAAQPGFTAAHLNFAIALMKSSRNDEAGREIQRALELDPEMAEAHLEKGLLLASESNRLTSDARKELEASLRLNPQLWQAIPAPVYEELLLGPAVSMPQ
jgi:tetratricopeptide (TPR) repeat protein